MNDLEIAHSNDAWIKEKENMKRNLDEYLKDIKSLDNQCNQYADQIEKLKKDVKQTITYHLLYKLLIVSINYFVIRMKIYNGIWMILRRLSRFNIVGRWKQRYSKRT